MVLNSTKYRISGSTPPTPQSPFGGKVAEIPGKIEVENFDEPGVFAAGSKEAAKAAPLKIGVPDDATNQARAIKLLETAGLITVDPAVGFSPELKDVTSYIYNIEIVPTQANTLTSTLDDFGASTINGTYATSYGLVQIGRAHV